MNDRDAPRQELTRLTVNLTPRASAALELAVADAGDSKTDTINRAIQVYAYLEHAIVNGGAVYVRETADGELERLKIT